MAGASVDWKRLLAQHHVEYVEGGPSTAKDNIYVHCPWCGASDRAHHLGISLRGRGWGCWRNPQHRGISPVRLLVALLRVSTQRASVLLGDDVGDVADDADLARQVKFILAGVSHTDEKTYPEIPAGLRKLSLPGPRRDLFLGYLQGRGYPGELAERVAQSYDLHYALKGPFAYRIVLPVRDREGHLVTLTGRSIVPDVELRYLTLSPDRESKLTKRGLPVASGPITNYLFNEYLLFERRPQTLVVCEGPFDAMRVDMALRQEDAGASATCLFGKAITVAQVGKLAELAATCDYKFFMLDPDARFHVLGIIARLEPFGFKLIYLSERWSDPGDERLSLKEIRRVVNAAREEY